MYSFLNYERYETERRAGYPPEIGALATKDKNTTAVMVWNYHDEDKKDAGETIHININNIPAKKNKLIQYQIDDEHSNSYELWKKRGSPQTPTAQQIAELEKAGQLAGMGKSKKYKVKKGNLVVDISLPRQRVSLSKMD